VFSAGDLVLDPLRAGVKRVAPQAFLAPPLLSPALAAAAMAREQLRRLAREGVASRGNRVLMKRTPATTRSLDALLWKI